MFSRIRPRWIVFAVLALLAFAQASIALAGCLTTRTASVASGEQDECALSALLCRAHCQAQDQTLDSAQIPVPDADALPFSSSGATLALLPRESVCLSRERIPLPASPPAFILFGRLLN